MIAGAREDPVTRGELMDIHSDSMVGKVCLITGATSGIGKEAAFQLARQGATLVLVGRDQTKCETTVQEIKEQTGNSAVEYLLADLSQQSQVRELAENFQRRHGQLNLLLNNAGLIFLSRRWTADGIEMTFGLNHLGYFLLTCLLLDTLKDSAPARIVNVSSDAHRRAVIDLDDLQCRHRYRGFWAYSRSKLANIYFTYELARRLEGTGVTVNALHPGLVATNFLSKNGIRGTFLRVFLEIKGISIPRGADTAVYLASSPEVEGVTGQYFVKRRAVDSSKVSYDKDVGLGLWQASLGLTGLEDIAPGPDPQSAAI
jgi:NAD(P)-dependent dehydrogenase (short-subunit alcohol dehydrogenase family)